MLADGDADSDANLVDVNAATDAEDDFADGDNVTGW